MKVSPKLAAGLVLAVGLASSSAGAVATATASTAASTAIALGAQPRILACTGAPEYEPASFVISCADANSELTATRWTSWTRRGATGVTRFGLNLCNPYCAASRIQFFPDSSVQLSRPVGTRLGELYLLLVVHYRIGGVAKTFSFSWAGDPSFSRSRRVRVAACRAPQLSGNLSVIPSSRGAGNVTYALELVNRSETTCSLSGLPRLQLFGRDHERLPTHVQLAGPGGQRAAPVVLRHGAPAWASARFSPDVPGIGEPVTGRCEATAYRVRVTEMSPGSALIVPVRPPTPVCEHGAMRVSMLTPVRPTS
ncbi:MAG: DUF4232 domain-containing protein [Acidimicrobiales bacterium]